MKILDWYIIRKFLVTVVAVLLMFSLIAVIFDMSERLDRLLESEASWFEILFVYYLNFIPYLINLVSPLLIFISAVYFTSRMANQSEILAILASGMSFYRLLVPYLFVAVLLAGFSYGLKGWIIPQSNKTMVDFESAYLDSDYKFRILNIHRQVEPGVFIYMESYSMDDMAGYKFSRETFDGLDLQQKLMARMIKWNEEEKVWEAYDWTIRRLDGITEELESGKKLPVELPLRPSDFKFRSETMTTMNNPRLAEHIETLRLRGDDNIRFYQVEQAKRISVPFATIILILIAVTVSARKVRGGIGVHLGIGIALAFSYLLFLQFSSTLATNSDVLPTVAVWLPNVVFGALGAFLLLRMPK